MSEPQGQGLQIEERLSPNHGERAPGTRIEFVILHYTGMPSAEEACNWLCDPRSQVSSHYFVHEDGRVLRLVPEERRAWHAGVARWRGLDDINSRSIGIEIANPGHDHGYAEFPQSQIVSVIDLVAQIVARHNILPNDILAHSDIAPTRKDDPGEKFPWWQLYNAGLGAWVPPTPIRGGRFFQQGDVGQPVEALQAMLALYGYDIEVSSYFDDRTTAVVKAFQRHFRPERVDGIADESTIETLYRLLAEKPQNA
ncbi:N-acetylmuramoyl-L-alanine amidase AmiD precursor [Hartmannibacter diazotrophicus]|uniref:N-acetylmuramoyl-L-alanine amidase n=1 Tax=Hartmannibacter diazotrophicus TaxID=1482074 RepID=A0A2C9D6G9_9HYPH|nr:N-acetylmuramoyl-L-alanine amidase [Hartmannibacter diazotrophicus]SON55738.1 N-acetylmuramoyl-L-alanine amidase AmiD precursor [Hartmannibacter diazotrophicus]